MLYVPICHMHVHIIMSYACMHMPYACMHLRICLMHVWIYVPYACMHVYMHMPYAHTHMATLHVWYNHARSVQVTCTIAIYII